MMLISKPEKRQLFQRTVSRGLAAGLAAGVLCIAAPAMAQQPPAEVKKPVDMKNNPEQANQGSAWVKLCEEQTLKKDDKEQKINVCLTHHERFHPTTGQPLISAAIRQLDNPKQEIMMIMVPLGRLLKPGLALKIGEGKPMELPYSYCTALGCVAETKATPELIDAMKKSGEMAIGTVDVSRKRIAFKVPLSGFTRALDGPPIDRKVYAEARKEMFKQIRARQAEIVKRAQQAAKNKAAEKGGEPKKAQ